MTTLTNTAIDALRPGQQIKDDRVPGLSVRAHRSGKSFMLYYRTRGGQPRRPKLGTVGVLSLSDARDLARSILTQVARGSDPGAGPAHEPTLNDLWDRCEREHYHQDSDWHREAKRLYTVYLKPALGKTTVAGLGYEHVRACMDGLAPSPVQANRALAVLSRMLNLAERWGYRSLGTNPCQHVARYKEHSRRRYATPAEIGALGAILDRYAADPEWTTGVAFIYLLLFSGARPSEIANGRPGQLERVIRGGKVCGVLRLADGKTGQRDVFLPPQAMRVLERLPPGRDRLAGRKSLPKRLWAKVAADAGYSGLWLRDLRRTFATIALSNGVSAGMVGELLGHRSAQTTKVYAKLMEDPAHEAAADTANRLENLMKA